MLFYILQTKNVYVSLRIMLWQLKPRVGKRAGTLPGSGAGSIRQWYCLQAEKMLVWHSKLLSRRNFQSAFFRAKTSWIGASKYFGIEEGGVAIGLLTAFNPNSGCWNNTLFTTDTNRCNNRKKYGGSTVTFNFSRYVQHKNISYKDIWSWNGIVSVV